MRPAQKIQKKKNKGKEFALPVNISKKKNVIKTVWPGRGEKEK